MRTARWRELDLPLKATALIASLTGLTGIMAGLALYPPTDFSAPPVYLFVLIDSFIPLAGAACILLVPMSLDRRRIFGFMTLVVSFPLIIVILSILDFILR